MIEKVLRYFGYVELPKRSAAKTILDLYNNIPKYKKVRFILSKYASSDKVYITPKEYIEVVTGRDLYTVLKSIHLYKETEEKSNDKNYSTRN